LSIAVTLKGNAGNVVIQTGKIVTKCTNNILFAEFHLRAAERIARLSDIIHRATFKKVGVVQLL
jgi:hypothetical protein